MEYLTKLYHHFYNPLLLKTDRPLPREAAIIGSGTVGPDIGYYLKSALPELILTLVDVAETPLQNAETRIRGYVDRAMKRKKINERKAKSILENIFYTTDYSAIEKCDLVIEAAFEDLYVKRTIFKQVEDIVSPETILSSTTSSIPAERLFSKLRRPERATITHFFAPAWRNPVVEVITWEKIDRKVLDYLRWMFCKTGKTPLVSSDAICFILDRVFVNWTNEAAYLLDIATASEIDKVSEEFVHAGPFFVLNLTKGNHLILDTNTLLMEEGAHYRPAHIFNSVTHWNTINLNEPLVVPDELKKIIRERLLGIILSEAFDIVNRQIGVPEDINLGCELALGFRKGPFDIMRDLGEEETERLIKKFQEDRPGFAGPEKPFSYYQGFRRHILCDVKEGVKIITIRRPHFLNSHNDEVNNEIIAALQEDINNPDITGFIITGYGNRAFSAGAEIGNFPEVLGHYEAAVQFARDCSKLLVYIDTMKKPVVAAVNGIALGGGLEIAMRCHSIVATSNAMFQFPEIIHGVLPGMGGCVVPYRKWPQAAETFHEMIRFGKPLRVIEAEQLGIVKKIGDGYYAMINLAIDEVQNLYGKTPRIPEREVHLEELTPVEDALAKALFLSPEALAIVDKTITQGAKVKTLSEALEIGYHGFGEIACTSAAKERITAFLEKRKPNFTK